MREVSGIIVVLVTQRKICHVVDCGGIHICGPIGQIRNTRLFVSRWEGLVSEQFRLQDQRRQHQPHDFDRRIQQ